jgi:hypothetical protein
MKCYTALKIEISHLIPSQTLIQSNSRRSDPFSPDQNCIFPRFPCPSAFSALLLVCMGVGPRNPECIQSIIRKTGFKRRLHLNFWPRFLRSSTYAVLVQGSPAISASNDPVWSRNEGHACSMQVVVGSVQFKKVKARQRGSECSKPPVREKRGQKSRLTAPETLFILLSVIQTDFASVRPILDVTFKN